MLQFLCANRVDNANAFAQARGWVAVGLGHYLTAAGDHVRVVRQFRDMVPTAGAVVSLYRCYDFAESADAAAFERLVKSGEARWIKS
jgi:hypothetical protein